jgi:glycosyltransferase involved in cell wall biosynthesis
MECQLQHSRDPARLGRNRPAGVNHRAVWGGFARETVAHNRTIQQRGKRALPRFSVIMPTHGDRPTLPFAVQSALAQTERDFELIVSGDGAGDRTREIVRELAAVDERIRFDDFPKGEQRGELNRGRSVASSRGRFVAYLPDDDLWMPQHLAVLGDALEEVDFAHTMGISVAPDGTVIADVFDALVFPDATAIRNNCFAIRNCVAGHRRDAYDALPHGWRLSAPYSPDTYMWLQFMDAPTTRYRSVKRITALGLPVELRLGMPGAQRVEEIREWLDCISDAGRREELIARVVGEMLERDHRASGRVRERLNVMHLRSLVSGMVPARRFTEVDPWFERGNPMPEPVVRAGDRVNFSRFGDYRLYAVFGMSEPEGWGCWIDGARAEIVLPVATETDGALALEVEYRGMIVPSLQPVVSFDVVVNDRLCATLTTHSGAIENAIVELPDETAWRSSGFLAVRIDVNSALRPSDHNLSADVRRLGVGLISLALGRGSTLGERVAVGAARDATG